MPGDEILELPQYGPEMRLHRFRRAFRAPFGDRLKNRPVLGEGSLHAPRRGKQGSTHPIKMHAQRIERLAHARQAQSVGHLAMVACVELVKAREIAAVERGALVGEILA